MSIVDTLVSSESIMVHVVAELFKIVSEIDSEKGKAAEAVVNLVRFSDPLPMGSGSGDQFP